MSDVPFAVREFPFIKDSYGGEAGFQNSIAYRMNAWFSELANDTTREYDIRQVVERNGGLLVFYEVTPAAAEVATCTVQCDTCGRGVSHSCAGCDNDE